MVSVRVDFRVQVHKVNFLFLVSVQVDFACRLTCGPGTSTKVWGQLGTSTMGLGASTLVVSTHVVYWSLKVADTVCLRPPHDASVRPGVQRSEGDP